MTLLKILLPILLLSGCAYALDLQLPTQPKEYAITLVGPGEIQIDYDGNFYIDGKYTNDDKIIINRLRQWAKCVRNPRPITFELGDGSKGNHGK